MDEDNPWLSIPAEEYEAHMSSPQVAQAQLLSREFARALAGHDARAVALLGASTGNGLEHVDPEKTGRLTAVDINPGYVGILRERHGKRLGGLEAVAADLTDYRLDESAYTLIFAGLVFEYLRPGPLLEMVSRALAPGGVLVSVLQMGGTDKVTPTPHGSLRLLEPVMELVRPCRFRAAALEAGLEEVEARTETLGSGKAFFVSTFLRN